MNRSIFISYSWRDATEVARIDNLFLRFQVKLTRDIRDLKYNANIHEFMNKIKEHDRVILYVSDSYLRSVNCMYEASQAMSMKDKVTVIIKKGTKLFGATDKEKFIMYWEKELRKVSKMDLNYFQQEINDTKIAYECIGHFIDFVKQDNRMNDQELDFDALLNELQIEKKYPNIITKSVYDWIAKYPRAKLFDVLTLINTLYDSRTIEFSEFPNIPSNEASYLFKEIRFEAECNGITLLMVVNDTKNGEALTIPYSHLVEIKENTMRGEHHAKYYFHCENPSKKQEYKELQNAAKYGALNKEELNVLNKGYEDTYRIIIHF